MARTGKRIGRLIGASERKAEHLPYHRGLQVMWTTRRLHTHPAPPRIVLRGVRGLTPGGGNKDIHRSW